MIATIVVMAVWTISTGTYFAFREDVLTRLIARQAEMQFGYEDRIAEMRAQVDRISSRQLLDQEQYEQKLEQILRRQAALESRASTLSGIGDTTGSLKQPTRSGKPNDIRVLPLKSDKGVFLLPADRDSAIGAHKTALTNGGDSGALARLDASLDRVEQRQSAILNSLEAKYEFKAQRMRGVLSELGIGLGRSNNTDHLTGIGGPFVAPQAPKEAAAFERQIYRISLARIQVNRLSRALNNVPVRKPVEGDIDLASSFGVRQDPFTGSPAMHTGVDIHGEVGETVRATADGTVTAAGWSGGYGRVVDIDHGNGLSTRYGHLSSIEVRVGQTVKTGQTIGKVGSTGRSTGPHLHYETRVKGEAVDPQKFLRAGERLDGSI
jgi:murein DD-endopeptidase MepM/ murein hydrolase activator NlpD